MSPTKSPVARPKWVGRWRYPYDPWPKQQAAHETFADEVLFGGAAGPGKTDWLLGEAIAHALEVPGSAGVIFRRTFPDLARPGGIIMRLLSRLTQEVATYHSTEHRWTFRNGSLLELAHLERDADVLKYQGAEYGLVAFDELTQFTEWQYRYMTSRLRAAGELRERYASLGLRPRTIAATNPGGPGHGWVKARFIDPAPPGVTWRPEPTEEEPDPGTRAFIPGRLDDNPALGPEYRRQLSNLPEDERRALLEGDWDIFAGQRFREFRRATHVIDPEDYPEALSIGGVTRAVGVDYGLDAPFAALWGTAGPDGLVVVYRELYSPGLTPRQQAEAILAAELPGERATGRPVPVALDPSTWARAPGQPHARPSSSLPPKGSIAGEYSAAGLPVIRANNDRLAGVALVADKLRLRADDRPRLLIFSTCRDLIRTLPALARDKARPEDVDTRGEDHLYDALRYLLMYLERTAPALDHRGPEAVRRHRTKAPTVTSGLKKRGF